ncbi:13084_t:CDS:2, partial [Gigaspora margarita]
MSMQITVLKYHISAAEQNAEQDHSQVSKTCPEPLSFVEQVAEQDHSQVSKH